MTTFAEFGLPESLNHTLAAMGYSEPTPIQAQAIPFALEGKDVLGSAQTGTGKTAAFSIPLVAKLIAKPEATALILTPTRELAQQILDIVNQLVGKGANRMGTALIIGGASMQFQLKQLRNNPRIIVGTPGRVNDHLDRGSLKINRTEFLVLDETDRMLDMGFTEQLEEIFKYLPKEKQTLMFSATLPKNIVKLASKYLNNPERVAVGSANTPIAKIKQEVIHCSEGEKYDRLLAELKKRNGTAIIFMKTKHGTERLAGKLNRDGEDAEAIHGDLKQNQRKRVIDGFRKMDFRVLVATDVAARGLDISHVEHVINEALPTNPEDFIHRIGRTGRAGAEGNALSFVTPGDRRAWAAITRLIGLGDNAGEEDFGRNAGGGRGGDRRGSSGGRGGFGGDRRDSRGSRDSRGGRGGFGGDRRDSRDSRGGNRFERNDRPREDRSQFIAVEGALPNTEFKKPRSADNENAGGEQRFERKERSNRDDRPNFEKRGSFSGNRSEGRGGERGGRSFGGERSEGRFEGRPQRTEGRAEGRFEPRGEQRSEGRGERSENRSEGRPARSFGGDRPQRAEGQFESRYEGRSEGRFEKPRRPREDRFDPRPRPEGEKSSERGGERDYSRGKSSFGKFGSKGGFGGKPGFKGGRSEGKPSFGGNRDGAKSGKPFSFRDKKSNVA